MTLRLGHVMNLPPAEREAAFRRAEAACAAEAVKIVEVLRKPRPDYECTFEEYCRWDEQNWRCVLAVRHPHPSIAAIKVSSAGDDRDVVFLPNSRISVRPQSTGRFVVVVIPKWLRLKSPSLCFETRDLAGDDWTDDERAEWASLSATVAAVNHEIEYRPGRTFSRRKRFVPTTQGRSAFA